MKEIKWPQKIFKTKLFLIVIDPKRGWVRSKLLIAQPKPICVPPVPTFAFKNALPIEYVC